MVRRMILGKKINRKYRIKFFASFLNKSISKNCQLRVKLAISRLDMNELSNEFGHAMLRKNMK